MIPRRANVEDAAEILALQKLAYRSEAEIYADYSIPPLLQTLEEIHAEFDECLFLEASENGRIIGSVRARQTVETCFIGRLVVHPDSRRRGVGTALMREIEARFPNATRFELFTGHLSERNLHLYHSLGYAEFRRERADDPLTLVFMRKESKREDGANRTSPSLDA